MILPNENWVWQNAGTTTVPITETGQFFTAPGAANVVIQGQVQPPLPSAPSHWENMDIEADTWDSNWSGNPPEESEDEGPDEEDSPEEAEPPSEEELIASMVTPAPDPNPFGNSQSSAMDIVMKKYRGVKPDMDKEEFYNRKLTKCVAFKSGRIKGDIGLEIECEGTHLFRTPFKYWKCHEDGSLRASGDHQPVEYVLKAPIPKDEVRSALLYLEEKLKEAKSKIVHSSRTSVHVHVNCQDMTVRELYCYLGLYMILEELLVEWSGPDRAGNLFCLRAKDSDFYIKMLESVLKDKSFKGWRDEYRYAACNVASIPKFGSLEFRSMKGTVDVDMISAWVDILWHVKEVAAMYESPVEIVEDFLSIGPLPFFKKIFSDTKMRSLFDDIPRISGKLWDGLRLFRDVAYSTDWAVKPEKKSPAEEEKDVVRYRVKDWYVAPGSDIPEIVRAIPGGSWNVRLHPEDVVHSFTIPEGQVMYYVDRGYYLVVDVRDGPVEFRED